MCAQEDMRARLFMHAVLDDVMSQSELTATMLIGLLENDLIAEMFS